MTNKAVKYGIVGIAVVLFVAVAFAGAASADTGGTAISTKSDWLNLSGKPGGDYYLVNDIDFGGESAYINSFSGSLDGRGCTIKNFIIERESNYGGLIGTYSGKSIRNITICNFSVSGGWFVGVVAGGSMYNTGSCTFENVTIMNGKVVGGGNNVGVFTGYATVSTMNFVNCMVKNCSVSGSSILGGFVGFVGSSILNIDNSYVDSCVLSGGDTLGGVIGNANSGKITVDSTWVNSCVISGKNQISGLIGYAGIGLSGLVLEDCVVANCVVKSSAGCLGGCLGMNVYNNTCIRTVDNCTVKNCAIYATSGSNPCGGIIGGCEPGTNPTNYPSVSNCTVEFCTIAGQGSNAAGGIAGTFPTAGILDRNNVISSCIVSVSGKAAGICPTATTAS